jgi:hydroxymethylpyrimidine/phosphomethylpyrimidine kinase
MNKVDYLYVKTAFRLEPHHSMKKHGSGCVLSSAITANLSKGENVLDACKTAKFISKNYYV